MYQYFILYVLWTKLSFSFLSCCFCYLCCRRIFVFVLAYFFKTKISPRLLVKEEKPSSISWNFLGFQKKKRGKNQTLAHVSTILFCVTLSLCLPFVFFRLVLLGCLTSSVPVVLHTCVLGCYLICPRPLRVVVADFCGVGGGFFLKLQFRRVFISLL